MICRICPSPVSRNLTLYPLPTTLTHEYRGPLIWECQNRSYIVVDGLVPLMQATQHVKTRTPNARERTLVFSPVMIVAIEAEDCDESKQQSVPMLKI